MLKNLSPLFSEKTHLGAIKCNDVPLKQFGPKTNRFSARIHYNLFCLSIPHQNLGNDATRNGDEHIVTAHLNPVVSSGRRIEMMSLPVGHYVLPVIVVPGNCKAGAHITMWSASML